LMLVLALGYQIGYVSFAFHSSMVRIKSA
jgi:hypothetical protein